MTKIQIGEIISLVTFVSSLIGILIVACYENRNNRRRSNMLLNFHKKSFIEETSSNYTEEEECSIFIKGLYVNRKSKGLNSHIKA